MVILGNGYKKGIERLFLTYPPDIRALIEKAHHKLFHMLAGTEGPYDLVDLKIEGGQILNDLLPNREYAGSLAGSWIWSHPAAYFRFRIITSQYRVQIWEFGLGPRPDDIQPVGYENFGPT